MGFRGKNERKQKMMNNEEWYDDETTDMSELYDHGYEPNPDDLDSIDLMPDERFSNCSPWVRELEDELQDEIEKEMKK